jgi:hypothetical protein
MSQTSSPPTSPDPALRGAAMTGAVMLGIMLPVALAVGDHGWLFSVTAFILGCVTVVMLAALLPHGPLFALSVVTGFSIYICMFVVIGRSAFPAAPLWAEPLGFALPVLAFLAATWRSRGISVAEAERGEGMPAMRNLARFARWLALCACVAVLCLGPPLNRLPPLGQAGVMLGAMAVIGLASAAFLRDVLLLLADVARILGFLGARIQFLASPMLTYTLLLSLMAVAFGCAYRIADGLSKPALFQKFGVAGKLSFPEAMHFSLVTLATVGYGDIIPQDDGIRLLASIQMILGQLLLLFGFAEIMRERQR